MVVRGDWLQAAYAAVVNSVSGGRGDKSHGFSQDVEMFGVPRVMVCGLLTNNNAYHLMDAKHLKVAQVCLLLEKCHHYKNYPSVC